MPPKHTTEVRDDGRVCTGCKVFKEFEGNFSRNGTYASGPRKDQPKWQSKCKECVNAVRRKNTAAKKQTSAPTTPASGAVSQQEVLELFKKLSLQVEQPAQASAATAPAPEKKRKSKEIPMIVKIKKGRPPKYLLDPSRLGQDST